jgi:hypothetical protein
MATRMQQRRGTAAQWTSADPVLAAGEIGFETDTSKFKIGDGVNVWETLTYFTTIDEALADILDGAPEALDTLKELAAALGDDADFATTIANSLSTKATILIKSDEDWELDSSVIDLGTLVYNSTTKDFKVGNGVSSYSTLPVFWYAAQILEKIDTAIEDAVADILEDSTFTGTIVLPAGTSIGDVSQEEISYLDGVTSSIQTQINNKLDSSTASTTYAPLADPTFTGTVVLPSTTSIGTVDSTELGYLNDVTSNIQTQLNAKAPTADPTFTGTVSGITSTMVGLGNVDNTSDADKPISTATQTALDAKLNLSGGTMTGIVTLSADPTQALHAVTKQYVDGIEAGLKAKPAVLAATSTNVAGTYNNGTNGVGATLTAASNGSINTVAPSGVSTWVVGSGILLKNQTNKAENGRYVVTDLGSESTPYVLTRCGLCDEASEIPGAYVFVQDGVHQGTGWVQIVADPSTFVVGTDDIDVFQFSGPGSITAGDNISVSGSQVSVVSNPTFASVITASSGVAFSDGTQTKQGVPSITTISAKTDSYTLSDLNERDTIVEISKASAVTLTIPTNATIAYPVGTTIDIIQTGAGQVTIAGAGGVTVNGTPGLKLRTQFSSATLLKRAENTWLIYGDLTA